MSFVDRASSFRRSQFERVPFVFCYDISCPKRARSVRRSLQRWRVDGQLSVHETVLTPLEAEELGVELTALASPAEDSLILFRLSRRGGGPIYALSSAEPSIPLATGGPAPIPRNLHDGWYIVAYDVVNPQRLRQVQRVAGAHGTFLQRSVYLFQGKGSDLTVLLQEEMRILVRGEDDARVYSLSGPDDLWFLCGEAPPLNGVTKPATKGAWQRFRAWIGGGSASDRSGPKPNHTT